MNKKVELTDEQKLKAMDWLKTFHADPPFDGYSNPCAGDGHFANQITREFGMSLGDLGQACGYFEWKKRARAAYERYIKEFKVTP